MSADDLSYKSLVEPSGSDFAQIKYMDMIIIGPSAIHEALSSLQMDIIRLSSVWESRSTYLYNAQVCLGVGPASSSNVLKGVLLLSL